MHRLSLGDCEFSILSDGTYELDGGTMFGVVPKSMWSKRVHADEHNMVVFGTNSLLMRNGDHTVIVDTGIGPKLNEKSRQIYRHEPRLLKSLEEAGVAPDEIDLVINTHLHFDHCGWNTYQENKRYVPTFPNARYYVQRGEVDHAHEQHERDRISYRSENYDPLIESGQMQLLTGDHAIAPGISVRVFPGHTRDLQAVIFRTGEHTVCYASDMIPTSHHLDPTWLMAYDTDVFAAIASKNRFHEEAIPQQWLVVYTHDHERPWSHVRIGERGRPAALVANLD